MAQPQQNSIYGETSGPMRKVAILSSVHPVFDHRIFHKEARSLVRAGYDVVWIVPHSHNQTVEGVRIQALPLPQSRPERMTKTVWQVYKAALKEAADVYHFHDPELLGIALLLKLRGKNVIYDSHEDVPRDIMLKDYIPLVPRWIISQMARFLEKSISRRLDGVIVAADQMLPGFRGTKRLVAVRNYPMLENYAPRGRQPSNGQVKFIYVGNVSEVRGITQVVRGVGLVPDHIPVKFVVYGPTWPDDYVSHLRAEKGFERLDYRGVVDFSEVPSHLREADVGISLLQPTETYTAGLPTKLFEYMACALPVVTSKFKCYDDVLDRYHCGVSVDPTDPQAIARVLTLLAQDPDLRQQMGENGRAASHLFSWEAENQKMLDLYQQVLGG